MDHFLQVGCKGVKRYVPIGITRAEQELKCLIEFNCRATVDQKTAHFEQSNTFDYVIFIDAINNASKKNYRMLEELGQAIIHYIHSHCKGIDQIELELIKKNPFLHHHQGGDVFILIRG